jgi:hypothetical protein
LERPPPNGAGRVKTSKRKIVLGKEKRKIKKENRKRKEKRKIEKDNRKGKEKPCKKIFF